MINKSYILKISFLIAFYVGFSIPARSNSNEVIVLKKVSLLKTTAQSIPFSEDAIEESYFVPDNYFTSIPTFLKPNYHNPYQTIFTKIKFKKSNILVSYRFLVYRNFRI